MHDVTTCDPGGLQAENVASWKNAPYYQWQVQEPPPRRLHGCDVPSRQYVPWESVWWTVGGAGMVALILGILLSR